MDGTKALDETLERSFELIIKGVKNHTVGEINVPYYYLIFRLIDALGIVQDEKPNLTEQLAVIVWLMDAISFAYEDIEDSDKPLAQYKDSIETYILHMLLNYCVYELKTITNKLDSGDDVCLEDLCFKIPPIKFGD